MKTIDGIKYHVTEKGILVPTMLLREAKSDRVRTPKDILPLLSDIMVAEQETVAVATLNSQNRVIQVRTITIGLVDQTNIHPREVFRAAVLDNACSIIVAHNHPSGDVEPSDADLKATRRLVDSGKTLGIPVLDHLVVGPPESWKSIREFKPACFA